MVLHAAINQHWGSRGRQISKYKVSLVCRVSYRIARAKQRNPVKKERKEGGRKEGIQIKA